MRKHFENFMTIRMTSDDYNNSYDYTRDLDGNVFPVYSKIVILLNEKDYNDILDADEHYEEVAYFVHCYNKDDKKKQIIYYTAGEEAFDEVVKFYKDYDCVIYQFLVEEQN